MRNARELFGGVRAASRSCRRLRLGKGTAAADRGLANVTLRFELAVAGIWEEKLLYVFGKEKPSRPECGSARLPSPHDPPGCLCLYWHWSVVLQFELRTRNERPGTCLSK